MASSKITRIRALLGFTNAKATDVVTRATAVLNGLTGNVNYPNPPVDLPVFKTTIDSLSAAIATAQDGSKKDIAAMHKLQETVIQMFRLLGTYVEANCKGDMATFTTSGFQPQVITKSASQPLTQPAVKKIDQGLTGQLLVRIATIPKAKSYEFRYGAVVNGAPPTSWTSKVVSKVKPPVGFQGLTPGTVYAIQVRAFGVLGYTNWTDSKTCMCV